MVRQILLKEGRGVVADSGGGTFFLFWFKARGSSILQVFYRTPSLKFVVQYIRLTFL